MTNLLSNVLVVTLAFLAGLLTLRRYLPLQNVAVIVVNLLAFEVFLYWGLNRVFPRNWTGIVFGAAVLICARGVGRLVLRPWRDNKIYGIWLIALTSLLAALFQTAAASSHYEMLNLDILFLLRLGGAGFFLIMLTPWFIRKQPGVESDDYNPLRIWLGLNVLLLASIAGQKNPWLLAGIGTINVAILGLSYFSKR